MDYVCMTVSAVLWKKRHSVDKYWITDVNCEPRHSVAPQTPAKPAVHDTGNQPWDMGIRKKISRMCTARPAAMPKVFNDSVHGLMEFHPLCVAIIDTPQFQRLRYLKQLGAGYFVYPGASHNRFEHCLGVCHLAGQLVNALQERQCDLKITEKEKLCVQIAGLCHDLGHGPFSHVFDNLFIPYVKKGSTWKHEQASVDMFDHMVKENNLEEKFEKYGLSAQDREFIKEQIVGKRKEQRPDKPYLYEIVANSRNGVDVDKWDYFKRDCLQLGMSSSFDHMRFLKFARVIGNEDDKQICVRDKVEFNMYEMFQNRYALHRKAYQHRVVKAVELMLVEAMKKANNTVLIPGRKVDGKTSMVKMSDCIDDMVAYTNLTDEVFHRILLKETDDKMKPEDARDLKRAQEILQDIHRRKLWKCVAETTPIDKDKTIKTGEIKETIVKHLKEKYPDAGAENLADSFVPVVVKMNFGKGDQDPVQHISFYTKDKLDQTFHIVKQSDLSALLPWQFEERLVRVYFCPTQDDDQNPKIQEAVHDGFKKWCVAKGYRLAGEQ